MKKYPFLVLVSLLIAACVGPERRTWIVPVTIDPSDLQYTPAVPDCFENRRAKCMDLMEDGIMVLYADDHRSTTRHEFRVSNAFFYLSGCDLQGAKLVLDPQGEKPYTLILPRHHVHATLYHGPQAAAEVLKARLGADQVLDHEEGGLFLDSLQQTGKAIFADFRNRLIPPEEDMRHANSILDEMRVRKDACEVERMQKACNITSAALLRVLKGCEAGKHEFEMEALIEGTFREYGSAMPGYPSIVGSGPNTCILHYESNMRRMEDGDLLLMDVGAEYGYYTADITRTIPVNGTFSPEQAVIYQLVLDAQKAAIEAMVPGRGYIDGHFAAKEVLVDGLSELGLITDPDASWQALVYILYASSHYLGLDVHDVGDMGGSFGGFIRNTDQDSLSSRPLEPGMVLTIEPGLYFSEDGLNLLPERLGHRVDSLELAAFIQEVGPHYEKYVNIGVRIEDDILITSKGNRNLSRYAPREIEDIEQLMARRR